MNDGKRMLYRVSCSQCIGAVCFTAKKATARLIIEAHRTRTRHKGQSFRGRYVGRAQS